MNISPKYKIKYDSALLLTIERIKHSGAYVTHVLLDDDNHTIETIPHYGYSKSGTLEQAKRMYNLRKDKI